MDNKQDFSGLTHEDLAILAQDGDSWATEYLIRAYKDVVKSKAYTYFIMGAEREDVMQEGMIGLFKAIKNYNPGRDASFKTFADTCINRQILTAIKAAGRKKHSPLNTYISINNSTADEEGQVLEETLSAREQFDTETILMLKEVMEYVRTNKTNSFSKMEITVWNEYMKGRTYEEIAKELGKNSKSVYNAMERTKRKIIAYLEK